MAFSIRKSAGEKEEFDIEKLKRSITRPGASSKVVEEIIHDAQNNFSILIF